MNSIVDPGVSMASTQPYGYDVLNTMYLRYRVLASAIRVRLIEASSSPPSNTLRCIVWPSPITTSFVSDPQGAKQQPYAKDLLWAAPYANNAGDAPTIKNYISIAKMAGDTATAVMNDDTYAALLSGSPQRAWYWNIIVDVPSGTVTQACTVEIDLIQYTVLFDRQSLAST